MALTDEQKNDLIKAADGVWSSAIQANRDAKRALAAAEEAEKQAMNLNALVRALVGGK